MPLDRDVFLVSVPSAVSPHEFYVQLHETAASAPYAELVESLKHLDSPVLQNPRPREACMIIMGDVNVRGRIISRSTSKIHKVLAVDLGYEDEYKLDEIRIIPSELLKLPPQAIKCCLKGFEYRYEPDFEIRSEFKAICKRQKSFRMKIINEADDSYVVELENLNTGEKIHDVLDTCEKINDELTPHVLEKSDWTEKQASFETYFNQKKFPGEKDWSLRTSPEKLEPAGSWDSASDGRPSMI